MMALRASSAECISNWDEASVGSGDILSAVCPIVRCTMGQMRQRARKTLCVFLRQIC